jgi:hypothetical protein
MQGFLVLGLLGEKIARRMVSQGVAREGASLWLEDWDRVIFKFVKDLDQYSEGIAATLMYKIMMAQEGIDASAVASDE